MSPAGISDGSQFRADTLAGEQDTWRGPGMDTVEDSATETAVVVISRGGTELAERLVAALSDNSVLYVVEKYADLVSWQAGCAVEPFSLPLRPVIGRLFGKYRRLVLVMPVGAAVRLVAPHLDHKHEDPAVVCVDDAGRFAVSLLSGHLGGADDLAQEIADALGATPVITSASHVKNTLAVDLLGREFGWQLEADSVTITRVSAAVVNGEPVAVLQEAGERDWMAGDVPLPANVQICESARELLDADCAAALIISDRKDPMARVSDDRELGSPAVVYRPRSLVVGMGCRRGVSLEHLEDFLAATFERHRLSLKSIKCIATADIKRDEPGILELAGKHGAPVVCYSADELNSVFDKADSSLSAALNRSDAARRLLGVWGVSEPAALLVSGASQLLVSREKTDRATIAVARIPFS